MAITLAGSPSTVATSGSGTTGAMDSTVGPADLLLEFISALSGANNQGKDSLTNTWVDPSVYANNTSAHYVSINHVLAPTTGAAQTFTAQTSAFFQGIIAAAFKGVGSYQASSYTGASETGPATSHPASSGSMTPSADGALIVTMLAVDPASTPGTITVPSGFTQLATIAAGGSNWPMVVAYEIQTTATARTPTWTTANSVRSAGASKIFLPPSAPALSTPTGNATGPTQATIGLTTDTAPTATTISYQILAAATGAPSAATIVGAPDGTITTGSAGALTKAITGLTTNTAVKVHFAQGASSNVVSSASFTPSTLAWSGTYPNQSGVAGAAFVHTGSVPSPTGGIGTKSYSATGLGASGLTMNSSTGQLQGTNGTAGTYSVTPTVVDQSTVGSSIPQTQSLAAFTLTISAAGSAPTVSANPSNLTVADGATATFSGGFNGSPTLSLQWQEFITGVWTAMSGETNINLSLGVVDLLDNGRSFRLGCTNPYGGPIYTSSATLTVTASSVGTITSDVLADWGDDTPLASTNIEFVTLLAITDDTVALQLVDQVTNTAGRLIIADAAITTGDDYLLVTRNADGSVCGCKAYTAT